MKAWIVLAACLLSACQTTKVVNTDARCDKLAWYARSVATLRDVGVQQSDLNQFATAPQKAQFSVRQVQTQVYKTADKTPADIYVVFYAMCINNGFENTSAVLAIQDNETAAQVSSKALAQKTISIPFEQPTDNRFTQVNSIIDVQQHTSQEQSGRCWSDVGHCD